jgi:hypothetical protein
MNQGRKSETSRRVCTLLIILSRGKKRILDPSILMDPPGSAFSLGKKLDFVYLKIF